MEVEQLPPLEHQRVVNFTRELARALRRISELSERGQSCTIVQQPNRLGLLNTQKELSQ